MTYIMKITLEIAFLMFYFQIIENQEQIKNVVLKKECICDVENAPNSAAL